MIFAVLHKTHAACADVVDVLQIAQRGNLNPFLESRFQYRSVFVGLDRPSVDFERYHV